MFLFKSKHKNRIFLLKSKHYSTNEYRDTLAGCSYKSVKKQRGCGSRETSAPSLRISSCQRIVGFPLRTRSNVVLLAVAAHYAQH